MNVRHYLYLSELCIAQRNKIPNTAINYAH